MGISADAAMTHHQSLVSTAAGISHIRSVREAALTDPLSNGVEAMTHPSQIEVKKPSKESYAAVMRQHLTQTPAPRTAVRGPAVMTHT